MKSMKGMENKLGEHAYNKFKEPAKFKNFIGNKV